MPSGHANHKGSSNKPNVNANGVIDDAVDEAVNPEDLLPEELTNTETLRVDEAVNYPPATQRPAKEGNNTNK
ncbi:MULTISPECIES: hypothetical protein [Calothrix]|uniref:Uncharacterized protein n=2 Tax=Calothrix TaxID=1186 RepID=A0ABR8AH93_9CYAN|nr:MULTISPECIES: hypothetical protein [Calothrix]MBD2199129.1 hypothetical protein [Calothrix parietina FACHB-288]MBD2227815.1 hypothetical protein [Calothrix anomala FACHB-343]